MKFRSSYERDVATAFYSRCAKCSIDHGHMFGQHPTFQFQFEHAKCSCWDFDGNLVNGVLSVKMLWVTITSPYLLVTKSFCRWWLKKQAAYLLDELVVALADVGLILNEDKTKLLTRQAQPPKTITTPRGVSVAVVDRDGCHKCLGCILPGNNQGSHRPDLEHHLQAASRAIFANTNIDCNKAVSLRTQVHFFDKIVAPVACFAPGHKICKTALDSMDVHFRRLLGSGVGPPSPTNWLKTGMLGYKIWLGGWRFDVVAAELTTVLAFVFVHCWFAWRSMGIKNFGLETPDYWKTWSAIPDVAFRHRNLLPLERYGWLENSSNEYTTLVQVYIYIYIYIFQTFAPSSSRVEVAYVRFQLYKRLCLEWATRANAPLVCRFHSLTHGVTVCLSCCQNPEICQKPTSGGLIFKFAIRNILIVIASTATSPIGFSTVCGPRSS